MLYFLQGYSGKIKSDAGKDAKQLTFKKSATSASNNQSAISTKSPFSLDDELNKLNETLSQNSAYVNATKKLEKNIEKIEKAKLSPVKQNTNIKISNFSDSEKPPKSSKFRLKVPQAHLITSLQDNDFIKSNSTSTNKASQESKILSSNEKLSSPDIFQDKSPPIDKNESQSQLQLSSNSSKSLIKSNSFDDFKHVRSDSNEKKEIQNKNLNDEFSSSIKDKQSDFSKRIDNFVNKTMESKHLNNKMVSAFIFFYNGN